MTFAAEIRAAHPESAGVPAAGKAWEVAKLARWQLAALLVAERCPPRMSGQENLELTCLVNWLLGYRDVVVAELEAGRSIPMDRDDIRKATLTAGGAYDKPSYLDAARELGQRLEDENVLAFSGRQQIAVENAFFEWSLILERALRAKWEAETLAKLATPNRVEPSEPWPRK